MLHGNSNIIYIYIHTNQNRCHW